MAEPDAVSKQQPLCAAELLCDRHPAEAVAFTIIAQDLSSEEITFGWLADRSRRYARALSGRGIESGDRVGVLMGKSAELPAVLLAIWRLGAVHVPLFTAFAGAVVAARLDAAATKLVVVELESRAKVADRAGESVFVVGETGLPEDPGLLPPVAVGADGPLVLMFTSGTTGPPKGIEIPLRALFDFESYLRDGLDVRADDVYWNAADPGWAYGLYYAVIAPMAAGCRSLLLRGGFAADRTAAVLAGHQVTNFAAAPTVYRALRAAFGERVPHVRLRCASSAGEPLTGDVKDWAPAALGTAVRDHYGQTETGMIIVDSWRRRPPEDPAPIGIGTAMPGWAVTVLAHGADTPAPMGESGRLAVIPARSPMMWVRTAPDPARPAGDHRYFLTGDIGVMHPDGSFSVVARDDDVIVMAGYRIGPHEVEAVLVGHEGVAEAAVVGMADDLRGEVVEAFVVLCPDVVPSPDLAVALQTQVKQQYAGHAYPRAVHFVDSLPKTPSGKVQRAVLRQSART